MATQIHAFGPNGELSPGAAAALEGLGGGDGGTVFFGSNAATARPETESPVIWIGATGIVPVNAIEDFDIVVAFEPPPEPEPEPPVNAPTLSVVAVSESRIDGTITPLIDATGYEWVIEAGTQSGDPSSGTPVDIEAATTFQATDLTAETTYTFWARGYNDDGPGPWSTPQVETTTAGLLTFTDDFETSPSLGRLTNSPNWRLLVDAWLSVVTEHETHGGYAHNSTASTLRANAIDESEIAFPADQWAEADVAQFGTGTLASCHVYVRAGAPASGTYYYGTLEVNGAWRLAKSVEDAETVLDSGSTTATEPHTLRIEADGDQITFWINDVEMASVTDDDIETGQPGIGMYRSGVYCTEFRAGALP